MAMSETSISKEIREMIRNEFPQIQIKRVICGRIVTRHGSCCYGAEPGWPDYDGYTADGRYIAIEIKDPGQKQKVTETTEAQDRRLAHARSVGAIAIKTTGVDDCRKQLEDFGL
jgi:hypothetical protein